MKRRTFLGGPLATASLSLFGWRAVDPLGHTGLRRAWVEFTADEVSAPRQELDGARVLSCLHVTMVGFVASDGQMYIATPEGLVSYE